MREELSMEQLNELIAANPRDAEAYYRRGRLYWKMGQRGAAISDYNRSAEIDPNGPGAIAAEQAMSIMNFFNPDQFNP